MKSILEFNVTLHIQAPYFSASQASQKFGIDNALLRDWNGSPAIAGSAIRGLLRHAWTELNPFGLDVDINKWLGKGDIESNGRSIMKFSHWFSLDTENFKSEEDQERVRYRIEIGESGSVKRGSLQVIEAPFNTGETLIFKGKIFLQMPSEKEVSSDEIKQITHCLSKGLNWISCVGGLNGIGFGKLVKADILLTDESKNSQQKMSPSFTNFNLDSWGIELSFDSPICFSKPQQGKTEGNLFESLDYVPGAAIIAVLAKQLPQSQKKLIDNLRVTHAFPCAKEGKDENIIGNNERPVPIPYSWAFVKNDNAKNEVLQDLALIQPSSLNGTPKFLLDWKGYEFAVAAEKQKWPKMYLHKLEETRTAISDTRAAESSQLFSMQMIDTRKLVWRANIDFSDVKEDKEQLKEHLKEILSQSFISPFGKTDAQASVKLSLPFSYSLPSDEIEKAMSKDEISLTLATDAQLFHKLPSPDQYHSMGSWTQAYQSVFDQLSPGTFQIIRQFCREKLIGGKFLSERFDKLSTTYTPRLLTEAGSVFVLKILDKEKAKTALSEWLKSGIPLIEHNDNWKKSPYRNFNGYGEIILNLQLPK